MSTFWDSASSMFGDMFSGSGNTAQPADFSGRSFRGNTSMDGTNLASLTGATGMPSGGGGMFSGDSIFGYKGADGIQHNGWGGAALGLGQGLLSGYQGMKQFGLAEDQFKESQRQYEQNYAAQKQVTNADMEDRQRARVASNPGAYQSVNDYMTKNGIK